MKSKILQGAMLLALPLGAGCASVGSLARSGQTADAWRAGCERYFEADPGSDGLSPDDRDALRAALHARTAFSIQARATEQGPFFARVGEGALPKPALVLHTRVAASAYPGSGVLVVPRLRAAGGDRVPWRGAEAWKLAGISPGSAGRLEPYNAFGALGDLAVGLLTAGGIDPQWRGTKSALPAVVGKSDPTGTAAQRAAFRAAFPHGSRPCVSREGRPCDSVALLAAGTPAASPEDGTNIDLGTEGPATGEAVVLRVIHMPPPSSTGEATCGVHYDVALPLPPGPTEAARVQAALANANVGGAAASAPPAAPPAPSAAQLVQQGQLVEACRRIREVSGDRGTLAEHLDARSALRALRQKYTSRVTGSVRALDDVHAEVGAPLLRGEIVPVAVAAEMAGPALHTWSIDVSVRYDGTFWASAVRHDAEHDALRLLFGVGAAAGLPPADATTTALATNEKDAPPASSLALLDRSCLRQTRPECRATVPLARVAPALGADVLRIEESIVLGESADCHFEVTRTLPLPPGATLADRLGALFARGPLPLDGADME